MSLLLFINELNYGLLPVTIGVWLHLYLAKQPRLGSKLLKLSLAPGALDSWRFSFLAVSAMSRNRPLYGLANPMFATITHCSVYHHSSLSYSYNNFR